MYRYICMSETAEGGVKEGIFCPPLAFSPFTFPAEGATWAGSVEGRGGPQGGEYTLGRCLLLLLGPTQAVGALQCLDNNCSSLVISSLQMPRYCHIRCILARLAKTVFCSHSQTVLQWISEVIQASSPVYTQPGIVSGAQVSGPGALTGQQ